MFVLFDGCSQLVADFDNASIDAKFYIRTELAALLGHRDIDDATPGAMAPYGGELADPAAARVRQRIEQLIRRGAAS